METGWRNCYGSSLRYVPLPEVRSAGAAGLRLRSHDTAADWCYLQELASSAAHGEGSSSLRMENRVFEAPPFRKLHLELALQGSGVQARSCTCNENMGTLWGVLSC